MASAFQLWHQILEENEAMKTIKGKRTRSKISCPKLICDSNKQGFTKYFIYSCGKGSGKEIPEDVLQSTKRQSKQRIHEKISSIYGKEGCVVGFPCGASGKESTCQCRRCQRCGFDPQIRKICWSWKLQPTPVFLPGKSHGQKTLAGYSPWGFKELDTTEYPCI